MRLEALHYLANEKRYAIPDGSTARFGGDMTTVRVGLTFYFN